MLLALAQVSGSASATDLTADLFTPNQPEPPERAVFFDLVLVTQISEATSRTHKDSSYPIPGVRLLA